MRALWRRLTKKSLALRRDLGDNYAIAIVLNNLGSPLTPGPTSSPGGTQYHQRESGLVA